MSTRGRMELGSVPARVYWTIRHYQPLRDLTRSDLMGLLEDDDPDVSVGAVHVAINKLRSVGLLLKGPRGSFLRADTTGEVPYELDRLSTLLVGLLSDCESGMSRRALAREARVCQAEVIAAMRPLAARYEVRAINIDRPAELDGGPGYQITPGQVQAREWQVTWDHPLGRGTASPTPEAVVADARHMIVAAQADAVAQTGQHRQARVGQHGAYAITASGRLQVTWGGEDGMRITVPAEVTRELLTWLVESCEAALAAEESAATPPQADAAPEQKAA